jgi:hypothetical protein
MVIGGCTENVAITNNSMSNCGLSAGSDPQVILSSNPTANSIAFTNNTYWGNSKHLHFFILCTDGPPLVTAFGNQTNTGLIIQFGP